MEQISVKPTRHDFVEDWTKSALLKGLHRSVCRVCGADIMGMKGRKTCCVCVRVAVDALDKFRLRMTIPTMKLSEYVQTAITDLQIMSKPLDAELLLGVYRKWMEEAERLEQSIDTVYEYVCKENEYHYDIWLKSGRTDTSNPYHQGAHCAMQDMGEWMRDHFKQLNP